MGNLSVTGGQNLHLELTKGRDRNCDFKCNVGAYFWGVWIVGPIHVMIVYIQCVFNFNN